MPKVLKNAIRCVSKVSESVGILKATMRVFEHLPLLCYRHAGQMLMQLLFNSGAYHGGPS